MLQRSPGGPKCLHSTYLVPIDLISVLHLEILLYVLIFARDLSAKWHCIKWDKYFWSMKYFCLPQFDTITLICYSCRDCSSEMIDINWIHIKHGFCAQYIVRNQQLRPTYSIFQTPRLHDNNNNSERGARVYVWLKITWERPGKVLQDFMPNYTRSKAKWRHFNTW